MRNAQKMNTAKQRSVLPAALPHRIAKALYLLQLLCEISMAWMKDGIPKGSRTLLTCEVRSRIAKTALSKLTLLRIMVAMIVTLAYYIIMLCFIVALYVP